VLAAFAQLGSGAAQPPALSNLAGAGSQAEPASSGEISGTVFFDRNANGAREDGEEGLAGQTVFIDLVGDGRLHPGDPITTTNERGEYRFRGLPLNATYVVRQLKSPFMAQTFPERDRAHEIRLSEGHPAQANVLFGAAPAHPSTPTPRPTPKPDAERPPQPKTPPGKPGNTPDPPGQEEASLAPVPGTSDALFQTGTFWHAAGASLALLAAPALRPNRPRARRVPLALLAASVLRVGPRRRSRRKG
jgi:hypothetical protein